MTPEQQVTRELSERLVKAQAPIRILDAIKWTDDIKQEFFSKECKQLPQVTIDYYKNSPLAFDAKQKSEEFKTIIHDAKNQLGPYSIVTKLIEQRCLDYIKALDLLEARGTPEFSQRSKELYGSPDDVFYLGGPRLSELGTLLGDILENITLELSDEKDQKTYSAEQALELLQAKLRLYFNNDDNVTVKLDDKIVADAAAGADSIKINSSVNFSERDIRYLEVHEGWVHVGTTLNGRKQPYCTFLGVGSPASTVTQEGLAVITEIFTFSSSPSRLSKLVNRVRAIEMANQGANFLDVFNFFVDKTDNQHDAYSYAMRVFRGSTPELGPFTKDLSYTKGFVLIYNFIRLAVQKNQISLIPLLFSGKVLIEEVKFLSELESQDLIQAPTYLPPQFSDIAALSSWMSLSLYLNKFDLNSLAKQYTF